MKKRWPVIILIVIVLSAYSIAFGQTKAETITMQELRDHVFFLASDEMGGRETGTPGYQAAVKYGVEQFKAAGLIPILTDAQGNKTFLQPVPFARQKIEGAEKIIVTAGGNVLEFAQGKDFRRLDEGQD